MALILRNPEQATASTRVGTGMSRRPDIYARPDVYDMEYLQRADVRLLYGR